MVAITLNKDEFIKRCEEVYERSKKDLEKRWDGKIVALYEEGIAAIGDNVDDVFKEASKKHPDRIFYVRRVGKFSASGYLF